MRDWREDCAEGGRELAVEVREGGRMECRVGGLGFIMGGDGGMRVSDFVCGVGSSVARRQEDSEICVGICASLEYVGNAVSDPLDPQNRGTATRDYQDRACLNSIGTFVDIRFSPAYLSLIRRSLPY